MKPEANNSKTPAATSPEAAGSTWFVGQTLPCTFEASVAMKIRDVITTHEALQASYTKSFWTKRKVWEEKHQRALAEHNEALRVLELDQAAMYKDKSAFVAAVIKKLKPWNDRTERREAK